MMMARKRILAEFISQRNHVFTIFYPSEVVGLVNNDSGYTFSLNYMSDAVLPLGQVAVKDNLFCHLNLPSKQLYSKNKKQSTALVGMDPSCS